MASTRLRFYGTNGGKKVVDLAHALSLHHRQMKRQKKLYTVYGGYFVDSQGSRIDLNVAPNNWVTRRAINRTFKVWKKQISSVLSSNNGVRSGKYSDFKVHLDNSSTAAYLKPADSIDTALPSAEWNYSTMTQVKLVDPDGDGGLEFDADSDQWDLKIIGPHDGTPNNYTRVGMIRSYLDSRAAPLPAAGEVLPPEAQTDPLSHMMPPAQGSLGLDEKIVVIDDEGDRPPYAEQDMYGTVQQSLQRVSTSTTVSGSIAVTPIHGFQALCGLVQLDLTADSAWELVLDVESEGEDF